MTDSLATDVAIVGGGPAGAALAIQLAHAGIETVLFERTDAPHWRACGVFSSPLTRFRLHALGFSAETVDDLTRPISALNLRTTSGVACRLEYAAGFAAGFDRIRLDAALLDRARSAGADVRAGAVVRSVDLPRGQQDRSMLTVSSHDQARATQPQRWQARLVVGADGPNSLVARTAGVTLRSRWLRKGGITFHRADRDAAADPRAPMEGHFLLGNGWYAGVAPVPRERVNVGIVVPDDFLAKPVDVMVAGLLDQFPQPRAAWQSAPVADSVAVALPLAHRVRRTVGPGVVLVGDACGFIDPLTGEGLHRALVSSELAADHIGKWLRGDARALEEYDRRLRARFRTKDVVSWVLQAFLAQPAVLEYAMRRLASRERRRKTFTLVMTDQVPASRVLDPRFLGRLLRP